MVPSTILKSMILAVLVVSCTSEVDYHENDNFYKGKLKGIDTYFTFVNDSTAALNNYELKSCGWVLISLNKSGDRFYRINGSKTDTLWVSQKGDNLVVALHGNDNEFEKISLSSKNKRQSEQAISRIQEYTAKGVYFECDYTFQQVDYFYDEAMKELNNRLKFPESAEINNTYIFALTAENEQGKYSKTSSTIVTIDVTAKNGNDLLVDSVYYMYFLPSEDPSKKFDTKFSSSRDLDGTSLSKLSFLSK